MELGTGRPTPHITILDGRNRYRACEATGTKPKYEDYGGDDPARFVLALNVARRHLTPSQAAMAAAKIANLSHGGDRKSEKNQRRQESLEKAPKSKKPDAAKPVSNQEAADMLGVHRSSVVKAKRVQRDAIPEVAKAVDDGKMALKTAHTLAKLPPEEQRKALTAGKQEVKQAVQGIQMVGKVGKKVKRKDMTPQVSHSLLVVAPFLYFAEQAQRPRALSVMCGIG